MLTFRRFLSALIFVLALTFPFSVCNAVSKKIEFAENNPVSAKFCKSYDLFVNVSGNIVVLVCIITGIGFFLGKVSWGNAMAIILGAAVLSGASGILSTVVGKKAQAGCSCRDVSGANCKDTVQVTGT